MRHPHPSLALWLLLLTGAPLASACDDDAPGDSASDAEDAGLGDVGDDVGGEDSSGEVDPDLDPARTCVVTIEAEGAEPWSCGIPPATQDGCDALGLCLCEHHRDEHVEDKTIDLQECLVALSTPRGAITLADVCARAGAEGGRSLADVADSVNAMGALDDVLFEGESLEASAACEAVGGYSVWGERGALSLTVADAGRELPPVGDGYWDVADYMFTTGPILTTAGVDRVDSETLEFQLTAEGGEAFEAEGDDLVGRMFLVHSGPRALFVGHFVSIAMSSARDAPVLVVEELAGQGFRTFLLRGGTPAAGPAELDAETLAVLRARLAAEGKLVDDTCVSSCGCMGGQACRLGRCVAADACEVDADCCLGTCAEGSCEGDAR